MIHKPRFLLVDDDEIDIETVRRAFRKSELDVDLEVARDGIEALAILRHPETPFPLTVIVDINMPRMNGIELLDEIRNDEDLRCLQVFVLTTSRDDRDLLAAYNRHVAGYIVKPVTFDKVCEAMSLLGRLNSLIAFPPRPPRSPDGNREGDSAVSTL